jgi:hypothetical protein
MLKIQNEPKIQKMLMVLIDAKDVNSVNTSNLQITLLQII